MSMSLRVQRPGANRGEFEDSSPSESRSEPPDAVGHMAVTVTTQILCVSGVVPKATEREHVS